MMYKISIIVCIVLLMIFIGVVAWKHGKEEQLGEQLDEAIADFLLVESKQKPTIIKMAKVEENETLILSYEKALELKQKFPVGRYTYCFKDIPWPVTQSLSIREFIEWLYENDYEIVKKGK